MAQQNAEFSITLRLQNLVYIIDLPLGCRINKENIYSLSHTKRFDHSKRRQ